MKVLSELAREGDGASWSLFPESWTVIYRDEAGSPFRNLRTEIYLYDIYFYRERKTYYNAISDV
jgi:hypothetical protein